MPGFRIPTFVLLFLMSVVSTHAQDKGFFRQVWLEEGLSQSSITSITQDESGYIWFGTQDGLNRYDGKQVDQYNFQPFNPNSISGDQIMNLYPARNNKLWILSASGLDLMDLKSGNTRHLSSDTHFNKKEKPFSPYRIWTFDHITFGYANGVLEKISDKNGNFFRSRLNPEGTSEKVIVYSMCESSSGLYAGTNMGIFKVDTITDTYKKVEAINFSTHGLNMCSFKEMLFFSDKCDLFMFNTSTGKLISERLSDDINSLITCAMIDNHGKLWIGTTGLGIYIYSFNDGKLVREKHYLDEPDNRFSLKCNSITCFFQSKDDKEENVWIGTRDAGAVCYSYPRNSFTLHSEPLERGVNFFGTVKDSRNIIYSGTNSGLHILEPGKAPVYIHIPVENLFAQRPVESIYRDSKDRIWLGVSKHLYKVENNKLKIVKGNIMKSPRTHIMDMIEYNEDALLIATNIGLVIYDIQKNELSPFPSELPGTFDSNSSIGALFTDTKGRLWIGSLKGLYCVSNGKVIHHFVNDPSDKRTLLADVVMDINESKNNEILVATTKGLSILVPSGNGYTIENYYKPEGLSNNFLYSVIPDNKGNFWISTNYGICRFDPVKRTFRSYHAADGLFINEFNSGGAYVSPDGELLFGGLGGLIGFYPDKLPVSKERPRILLKSITVNQHVITDNLEKNFSTLPHDQNNIQLEFSVIDFSTDGKKKLIYKLNETQPWMTVNGTNTISLANLAPGSYKLFVKAANRDGLESSVPLIVQFTINPPYYQTWWFYTIIAACAGAAAWMIYRSKLKQKIFAIQERERIREEENEKLRKTAALDLHDEFGNGLTRISMLVELTRMKVSDANPEASKLLDVISDNSIRLYNGTKDYIWSINAASDNLYEVIIRIKDFGDEVFYERGIHFHVDGLNENLRDLKQIPGTGRNVTMIFKEALSNIVKHSNATEVILYIDRSENGIQLKLKDNGKGFSTESSSSGFGLGNMKQRASRIKGDLAVTSAQGEGSEVALTLKDYR